MMKTVWRNCVYEFPRVTGYDEYGEPHSMNVGAIVNYDELAKHLVYRPGSNIMFIPSANNYWDWKEYPTSNLYVNDVCQHFWVNVGFTSFKLVCKHCEAEAPEYIRFESKPDED